MQTIKEQVANTVDKIWKEDKDKASFLSRSAILGGYFMALRDLSMCEEIPIDLQAELKEAKGIPLYYLKEVVNFTIQEKEDVQ